MERGWTLEIMAKVSLCGQYLSTLLRWSRCTASPQSTLKLLLIELTRERQAPPEGGEGGG